MGNRKRRAEERKKDREERGRKRGKRKKRRGRNLGWEREDVMGGSRKIKGGGAIGKHERKEEQKGGSRKENGKRIGGE